MTSEKTFNKEKDIDKPQETWSKPAKDFERNERDDLKSDNAEEKGLPAAYMGAVAIFNLIS